MHRDSDELERAYRNTTYRVDHPAGDFGIRIDEPCARLDALLREHGVADWAYVTACNPRSQPLSNEENAVRHAQLMAQVRGLGLRAWSGRGVADDGSWAEESLLILGLDEAAAVALGAAFEQHAVLVGRWGGVPRVRWVTSR